MDLSGKVAIVTGAGVRLGRAFALNVAEAGCDVCVHYYQSEQPAQETVAAIRQMGCRACAVSADLSNPEQAAKRIVAECHQQLGPASVLINSAAIFEPGTCVDTTTDQWDRHLAINLAGPFHLSREFSSQLPGDRGHIINIADWRATRPVSGHLAYTLSKSALVSLTRILAQELAPAIQVNAIAPGAILPATRTDSGEFEGLSEAIPLRRTGQPSDLTEALQFLLRSDFVTGEVIHVNGGQHL